MKALFLSAALVFAAGALAGAAPTTPPDQPAVTPSQQATAIGTPAWLPASVCNGNCQVNCESGATDSYFVSADQCCLKAQGICRDGSNAVGSEWYPVTCGVGVICP
ncbi:MAG TPA: hypothetical protein VLC07_09590 [Solirubrobacterales bacterium]|nr:hypothetical protein [Solirubrobacterales bacterium]